MNNEEQTKYAVSDIDVNLEQDSAQVISDDKLISDIDSILSSSMSVKKNTDIEGMRILNSVVSAKTQQPDVDPEQVASVAKSTDISADLTAQQKQIDIQNSIQELTDAINESYSGGKTKSDSIKSAKTKLDIAYDSAPTLSSVAAKASTDSPWAAAEAAEKQELDKLSREILDRVANGEDASDLEDKYSFIKNPEAPLETPIYDPIDLIVDAASFGGTSIIKSGIRGLSKIGLKGFAKGTATDLAMGVTAGGFMTLADINGASESISVVSGIIGSVATSSLCTLTRRGLAEWLKRCSISNKSVYNDIISKTAKKQDKLSKTIHEISSNGFSEATGDISVANSALATISKVADANEDAKLLDTTAKTVIAAQDNSGTNINLAAKDAAGAGDAIETVGIANTTVPADTTTKFGTEIHNADVLSVTVGPHVLWDKVSTLQEKIVGDIKSMNIFDGTWDLGPNTLTMDKGVSKASWILSPSEMLKGNKSRMLVEDATFSDNQYKRLTREFTTSFKSITKTLTKAERSTLFNMMDTVNQSRVKPRLVDGGMDFDGNFIAMSDKTIDAYYATRILLNHVHDLTNRAAVIDASKHGVVFDKISNRPTRVKRGVDAGTLDVNGVEWTKDHKANGYLWLEDVETKEGRIIKKSDLSTETATLDPNTHKLLSYEDDYIPIMYKDEWRVLTVKQQPTGKLECYVKATAPNQTEAKKAMAKLSNSTVTGSDEPAMFHFAMRKGDSVVNTLHGYEFFNNMHRFTPEQLYSLQTSLRNEGLESSTVQQMIENVRAFSYKKNTHFFERAGKRLKGSDLESVAPIVPSQNAIAQYLQNSASYIAKANYNSKMRDSFLNTFSDFLDDQHNWDSLITLTKAREKGLSETAYREAVEINKHLHTVFGLKSAGELAQEAKLNRIIDTLHSSGHKKIADIMDISPVKTVTGLTDKARQIAAIAKLGMFNVSQLVTQASGTLFTVGRYALYNPAETILKGKNPALQGGRDFLKHVLPTTKEGEYLRKIYRQSGYGDSINFASLDDTIRSINGKRSALGTIADASNIAFRSGEGINQGVAWFAARRMLIDDIMAGRMPGFKITDIDSMAFIREVSAEARKTSMNMSKYNQPKYARGIAGVPFQFFQFATHAAEMTLPGTGKLSAKEKAGIWATMIGTFGASGVPFLMDAAMLGETAAEMTGNYPQAVGATDRLASDISEGLGINKETLLKGMSANAATDLTHRIAIGYLLQNYYDGVHPSDLAGASGKVLMSIVGGTINTVGDLYQAIANDKKLSETDIVGPFTEISGVYNPYRAVKSYMSGEIRSKEEKLLKNEPDLSEILLLGLGFTPKSVSDVYERNTLDIRVNKAWKRWSREKAQEVARTQRTDPKFAQKLMKDYMEQVRRWNPMKVNRFTRDYIDALIQNSVPADVLSKTRIRIGEQYGE